MKIPHTIAYLLTASALTMSAWAIQDGGAPAPAAPGSAPAAPPAAAAPVFVLLDTSRGKIVLELDPAKAPISVANFMEYVKSGFYDGTVFHRVVPNFVVQGGGFDGQMVQKQTRPPIKNEWTNGLKNLKGTISMARLPNPDSATSQFFLNLKDNAMLDGANGPGYAVFGKIVAGMNVLDAMGSTRTAMAQATDQSGVRRSFPDVPAEPITLTKASEIPAAEAAALAESSRAAAPAPAPANPAEATAPAKPVTPGGN